MTLIRFACVLLFKCSKIVLQFSCPVKIRLESGDNYIMDNATKVFRELIEKIEENPVIAAVRKEEDIEYAVNTPVTTIFLLKSDIFSIERDVQRIRQNNKNVFIHMELLEGIGKDNKAMDYIAEVVNPSGIITTRISQVKYAKEKGICAIQRFFLVDSQSYETAIKSVHVVKPDMVEIMPAVMPGIISRFCKDVYLPVIAGGLIDNKEDMLEALKAGALGISTGKRELWEL